MKMISSTRSTSMSGVTLMFAFWPPLAPSAIPIVDLLYCPLLSATRRWRGRGRRTFFLALIGQKAQLIYARRPDVIHHFDHSAELGARVRANVNPFVRFVGQTIL